MRKSGCGEEMKERRTALHFLDLVMLNFRSRFESEDAEAEIMFNFYAMSYQTFDADCSAYLNVRAR